MVFTTKRTQTPPGRVWVLVRATHAQPTTKGVGELTGCHPNRKRASKMADPVKGRAEPREGYRYRARYVPVVVDRKERGTEVPVEQGLGWGCKAQPIQR